MTLIVVDGLDGCGKDTHAIRIRKLMEIEGKSVRVVSHPSNRFFGRLSKRSLQASGPMARLFATAFFIVDVLGTVRAYKRAPEEDYIFVRYLLGAAYLPRALAPAGYAFFRRVLPFPDFALFIDIRPDVAQRRIAARGHLPEMFETPQKLAAVREIAKGLTRSDWVTVDNSIDGEEPFREVEKILRERSILRPAL
ncbi:MAG: thymidylate kinase [Thermoplasmata archaeon]|nr:thymidylate kinase [Thermoplasmata archaeon]